MDRQTIIGRQEECACLAECMRRESAQLIAVYGRLRVGKTYLVEEFFGHRFAFSATGDFRQPADVQLRRFHTELERASGRAWALPKNWIQAFLYLREYLNRLPSEAKQVVFFDEMPWFDTPKSGFLHAFEWFWRSWASSRKNLVFVACGSSVSWMLDNVCSKTFGKTGKNTSENREIRPETVPCRVRLRPFRPADAEAYLASRGIRWSRQEVAECCMIMGGIPYYLGLLRADLSLQQNVDRLFFRKKGELWDEFGQLYRTLSSNRRSCVRVLQALSAGYGLTRNEIAERTGLPPNGTLTKILGSLESYGFISVSAFFGRKKKDALYRLADEFILFYFRMIRSYYGTNEHFWSDAAHGEARKEWAALTFELLCRENVAQIKKSLGISGVRTAEYVWFPRGTGKYADGAEGSADGTGKHADGAEDPDMSGIRIGLLIDRADRIVDLCEMRYAGSELAVDGDQAAKMREKQALFRQLTGCGRDLQTVMITPSGVKKNEWSGMIRNVVTLDDLFA